MQIIKKILNKILFEILSLVKMISTNIYWKILSANIHCKCSISNVIIVIIDWNNKLIYIKKLSEIFAWNDI